MFKKKYEKYTKILNRLTWLNACSSEISIATGIPRVATFATFVGLPVSVVLGAASLTGVIASGIISTLTKKYQKKLKKVTCLIDIVMRATVVFDRVISVALKDGIIDEEKLNTLQTFHLETLNELNLMRGSSYLPLPNWLARKKAIINPKNEDQECFKWAVIAASR